MTKSEALEYLELPEDAADIEIKKTMEEKLEYFGNLSEKAPSDFLKKLNAQKVLKIKTIQEESKKWLTGGPFVKSIILPDNDSEESAEDEEDFPETTPIIISSGSRSAKRTPITEPAGWLVRHTEDQSPKTFSLWKGNNYIGRKIHDTVKPLIVIDEDLYISRIHALITVEGNESPSFYIEDSAASNKGTESKNGTYINGNEKRMTKKTKLKENDTIQIGVTKLILRYNNNAINKIIKEVEKSKFMHTVALDL